jgi:GT2 family glycosyltransferase
LPHVRDIADDVRQAVALYAAASPPQVKDVAAVVLNFRTPDETLLATRSILASDTAPSDVVVVNNDTHADPVLDAHFARVGRGVRRVETGSNLGFSGGMNVGLREALSGGAGFALVANSDVVVPPDCIGRLVSALERHPGAGIAGPAVLSRREPDRIESLGLSFAPATGRMRVRAAGSRVTDHDLSSTTRVDAVSGCLMLIRRDVFDAIGWFDEAYFFGFEDLDFCLRARGAGFATIVAGGARVYHEGGQSIGAASPRRLYFAARNHLRFAERTQAGAGPSPAWRTWTIVGLNLAHAVRPGAGRLHARVAAVLRGTRDHRRGRFGPDTRDPT